jgi:hypothetical protein
MKLRITSWLAPLASLLVAAFAMPASAVTVDLLVLYDSYTSTYFSNQPATAIKSWVDQMNVMNQNSQVDIQWRLVGAELHNDSSTSMDTVLRNITADASIKARRDALGADYVTQLHKSGGCGIGWVAVNKSYAYNVVGPSCGPNTMAHELGHTMGLTHSRAQGDTGGTRYRYGIGYGVDGKLATLMAYESVFHTAKTPKYSNPRNTCNGIPCGVPAGQAQEADAAQALNNVRSEIAAFYPTKVTGGGGTTTSGGPAGYTWCAKEGGTCQFNTLVDMAYGAKGAFNYKYGVTGSIAANNSTFGDPASGVAKAAYYRNVSGGTYELRAKHSGLCLDLKGSGTGDGVAIQQYACNSTPAQAWIMTDVGGGKFEIKSKSSGKCMDVSQVSTADMAPIWQWTCLRTNNQLWYPVNNGDGTVRLQAVHSGKVADVNGGSTQSGVPLIQFGWTGSQNQRWTMRSIQ